MGYYLLPLEGGAAAGISCSQQRKMRKSTETPEGSGALLETTLKVLAHYETVVWLF